MGHDASKVLMGATRSNIKDVDNRAGNIEAGMIARLKTDGTLSSAAADGGVLGISLGRSLSGTSRTAVARTGLGVPLKLTAAFTPVVGTQVFISDTTGLGIATGAGATGMNAVYASGLLSGVPEVGTTEVPVAYIDMPGGL